MAHVKRHDPFGGAFGAALATGANGWAFTTSAGVTELREAVPVFADGFHEQLRVTGRNIATELATFGLTTADIVDATVFVHPDVDIDPGLLLDALQAHVFGETVSTLTIMRAASIYGDSLIVIKVVAFNPDL